MTRVNEDGLMAWYVGEETTTTAAPARREASASEWRNPVPNATSTSALWFPWWRETGGGDAKSFLVRMQTRPGEALLVDPGSPDNLVGDRWSARQQKWCRAAGLQPASYADIEPFTVGGVGRQAQVCRQKVMHHIALEGGEHGTFEAPEIPDSEVPALLGLRAMREHRALLDVYNRRLYRVGPGGYKLQLSPGSSMNELEVSNSGHLMLPCSEFEPHRKGGPMVAFPSEQEEAN